MTKSFGISIQILFPKIKGDMVIGFGNRISLKKQWKL